MSAGPSPEQCSANAPVLVNGQPGFAIWYPQMGGYVGTAVVVDAGGCFNAFVWHDGEFPFERGNPRELHHCNPAQFTRFGNTVARLLGREEDAEIVK